MAVFVFCLPAFFHEAETWQRKEGGKEEEEEKRKKGKKKEKGRELRKRTISSYWYFLYLSRRKTLVHS